MDQDDPTPDDFDTPWKTALTRYLPEFMAFYFPEAHAGCGPRSQRWRGRRRCHT